MYAEKRVEFNSYGGPVSFDMKVMDPHTPSKKMINSLTYIHALLILFLCLPCYIFLQLYYPPCEMLTADYLSISTGHIFTYSGFFLMCVYLIIRAYIFHFPALTSHVNSFINSAIIMHHPILGKEQLHISFDKSLRDTFTRKKKVLFLTKTRQQSQLQFD